MLDLSNSCVFVISCNYIKVIFVVLLMSVLLFSFLSLATQAEAQTATCMHSLFGVTITIQL